MSYTQFVSCTLFLVFLLWLFLKLDRGVLWSEKQSPLSYAEEDPMSARLLLLNLFFSLSSSDSYEPDEEEDDESDVEEE
uniref:Uncharacterized protein n=1 Tax=Lepeophtheirus salmonis TaxID=72036 RepID=A0A0K2VE76_LEPSM